MAKTDRNFDSLAARFAERIHGSYKGRLREDLLWWQMQQHMPALMQGEPLRVLDAGGGLGQMSLRLAQLGHLVTLNDISMQMLERARKRFDAELPGHAGVEFRPGPVQALRVAPDDRFDVIVCHALLEWLAEPRDSVRQLLALLQPGGLLSLAFYNRHALVYASARRGNIDVLVPDPGRRPPRRKGLSPRNAQYPEHVLAWLADWRVPVRGSCGIRVISDWLDPKAREQVPYEQLLRIEQHYACLEPYCRTGRYFHLIAEKPA